MPDTPPIGVMRLTLRLPWDPSAPNPQAAGQKVHVAIAGEALSQGTIVACTTVEDGYGLRLAVEIHRWPTRPCESCNAAVIWTWTVSGAKMPVDAEPCAGGNIKVVAFENEARSEVLPAKNAFGRTDLRKSHFATCPDGDTWRKKMTAELRRTKAGGRRKGGAS